MTQTEKNIECLKKFLDENNIEYRENVKGCGVMMDICITKMMIAVKYGDDNDFFQATKRYYAPFFVRETETEAKTLEKITNCCIMQMKQMQYMATHNGKKKWFHGKKKAKKSGRASKDSI